MGGDDDEGYGAAFRSVRSTPAEYVAATAIQASWRGRAARKRRPSTRLLVPRRWVPAAGATAAWAPGHRLFEDVVCDDPRAFGISPQLLASLLRTPAPLPPRARYAPTRLLLHGAWLAVFGRNSPLRLLAGPAGAHGMRVKSFFGAAEREALFEDVWRKLTAEAEAPRATLLAEARTVEKRLNFPDTTRAGAAVAGDASALGAPFFVSKTLMDYLLEVPRFVRLPSGWVAPLERAPPPPTAAAADAARRSAQPLGGAREHEVGARGGCGGGGGGGDGGAPAWRSGSAAPFSSSFAPPSAAHDDGSGRQPFGLGFAPPSYEPREPRERPRGGLGYGERDAAGRPRGRSSSPARRLLNRAAGRARLLDLRLASPSGARRAPPLSDGGPSGPAPYRASPPREAGARGAVPPPPPPPHAPPVEVLGWALAALEHLLWRDFARAIDAFRAWDEDGDGQLRVDELVRGVRSVGVPLSRAHERALRAALGARAAAGEGIAYAQLHAAVFRRSRAALLALMRTDDDAAAATDDDDDGGAGFGERRGGMPDARARAQMYGPRALELERARTWRPPLGPSPLDTPSPRASPRRAGTPPARRPPPMLASPYAAPRALGGARAPSPPLSRGSPPHSPPPLGAPRAPANSRARLRARVESVALAPAALDELLLGGGGRRDEARVRVAVRLPPCLEAAAAPPARGGARPDGAATLAAGAGGAAVAAETVASLRLDGAEAEELGWLLLAGDDVAAERSIAFELLAERVPAHGGGGGGGGGSGSDGDDDDGRARALLGRAHLDLARVLDGGDLRSARLPLYAARARAGPIGGGGGGVGGAPVGWVRVSTDAAGALGAARARAAALDDARGADGLLPPRWQHSARGPVRVAEHTRPSALDGAQLDAWAPRPRAERSPRASPRRRSSPPPPPPWRAGGRYDGTAERSAAARGDAGAEWAARSRGAAAFTADAAAAAQLEVPPLGHVSVHVRRVRAAGAPPASAFVLAALGAHARRALPADGGSPSAAERASALSVARLPVSARELARGTALVLSVYGWHPDVGERLIGRVGVEPATVAEWGEISRTWALHTPSGQFGGELLADLSWTPYLDGDGTQPLDRAPRARRARAVGLGLGSSRPLPASFDPLDPYAHEYARARARRRAPAGDPSESGWDGPSESGWDGPFESFPYSDGRRAGPRGRASSPAPLLGRARPVGWDGYSDARVVEAELASLIDSLRGAHGIVGMTLDDDDGALVAPADVTRATRVLLAAERVGRALAAHRAPRSSSIFSSTTRGLTKQRPLDDGVAGRLCSLEIDVAEGRGLPTKNAADGASDPYAELHLLDVEAAREQSVRTEVAARTLAPLWREGRCSFEVPATFAGVHVLVYDHAGMGGRHQLMGELILSAAEVLDLAAHGARRAGGGGGGGGGGADALGEWHALTQPPGSADGAGGSVRLWLRSSAVDEAHGAALVSSPYARAASAELRADVAQRLARERTPPSSGLLGMDSAGSGTRARWEPAKWPADEAYATLSVRLLEARGLKAGDANGLSDPYARVFCAGSIWQTSVVARTLDPRWDEQREFAIDRSDALLHVVIFDWDAYNSHDYLGELLIPVAALAQHGAGAHRAWYELGAAEPSAGVRGRVLVESRFETVELARDLFGGHGRADALFARHGRKATQEVAHELGLRAARAAGGAAGSAARAPARAAGGGGGGGGGDGGGARAEPEPDEFEDDTPLMTAADLPPDAQAEAAEHRKPHKSAGAGMTTGTGLELDTKLVRVPRAQRRMRVHVRLLRARQLGVGDWTGSSDPYAVAFVGASYVRTPVRTRTLAPQWDSEATLDVPLDGSALAQRALHIVVFDWDFDRTDDFLGEVLVPMAELHALRHGTKLERWFRLTGADGASVSGAVLLELRSVVEADRADDACSSAEGTPRARMGYAPRVGERGAGEDGAGDAYGDVDEYDDEHDGRAGQSRG